MATATKPIAIPGQEQNESNLTTSQSYCYSRTTIPFPVSPHSNKKSGSVPKDLHKQALEFEFNLIQVEMRKTNWYRSRPTDRPLPHSMYTEPNFRSHVEQDVGRELRIISDILHIQASGFGKGYDFASHRCVRIKRSSSFPGTEPVATKSRVEQGWSGVIPEIASVSFHVSEQMDEF